MIDGFSFGFLTFHPCRKCNAFTATRHHRCVELPWKSYIVQGVPVFEARSWRLTYRDPTPFSMDPCGIRGQILQSLFLSTGLMDEKLHESSTSSTVPVHGSRQASMKVTRHRYHLSRISTTFTAMPIASHGPPHADYFFHLP